MSTRGVVLGALAAAVATVAGIAIFAGGEDPYVIRAVYADADGLKKNSEVKIAGVPAGSVEKVALDKHDHAVLTFELKRSAGPIGAGAVALVRPVNLLGEKYADLRVGDVTRPLPSGSTIPVGSTGAPVELDDVLDMLEPTTRARLRVLIAESGVALDGRGADFNRLLHQLPGSLSEIEGLLAQLADQNAAMRTLIHRGDRVVASVSGRRDALGRLVGEAAGTLDALAGRRAQLGRTVRAAQPALRQLTSTLHRLDRTAQALRPAAGALRRAAEPLDATLRALPGLARDARPTLRTATEVAPELSRLGRRATPTVRELRPTAERLATFAGRFDSLTKILDGEVLHHALRFMHNWAKVIQRADGIGHVFRIHAVPDEELVTSAISRYLQLGQTTKKGPKRGAPPSKQPLHMPLTPPAGSSSKPLLPDLPATVPPRLLEPVKKGLDGLLAPLTGSASPSRQPAKGDAPAGDLSRLVDYLIGS